MRGEAPADYEKLDTRYGEVLQGIEDTVFVFALRRYHLDEQANLFEQDRLAFEIQREIGRRVLFNSKDSEIERLLSDYFLREYGKEALRRVEIRVMELRKLWRRSASEN
jgi:UTP:GlnB (protein PII) uridylyltransferase